MPTLDQCREEVDQYFMTPHEHGATWTERQCLQPELFPHMFPERTGTWYWARALYHGLAWQKDVLHRLTHEPTWRRAISRPDYTKTPHVTVGGKPNPWADKVYALLATNGKVTRDFRAALAHRV